MALDWQKFLRQHRIEYGTRPIARGWVSLHCPLCGPADPSQHLGVYLRTGKWNCWRSAHRGIPHTGLRLIQLLLHCTEDEAQRLLGEGGGTDIPTDAELFDRVRAQLGLDASPSAPKALRMPKEFKPLLGASRFAEQFQRYLRGRGYRQLQAEWLCEAYDLRYATQGRFRYRVIVPVYSRKGVLLTWTARTILAKEEVRYLTLSKREQVCAPKETLLGLPLLWECEDPQVLVICEGPFDAMRVTTFGRFFGVYGTCLFGLSLQSSQMNLLAELRARFPRQVLLLDAEASFQAFSMAHAGLDLEIEYLPTSIKDPGEMPAQDVIDMCVRLAN